VNQPHEAPGQPSGPATARPFASPRPSGQMVPCYEFRMLLQAKRARLLHSVDEKAPAPGENARFDEIERALARMTQGTYGFCIHCGTGLGRELLKFDPTAERCPAHAES
jgi:hypothetical protein